MFKNKLTIPKHFFGIKDMKKAFFQFLNLQAGAVYRGAPQFKQRSYKNVEITQQFKKMQNKRKQQRLIFAQKRKQLLQSKLSNQSKLLTQYQQTQLSKLTQQITSLQHLISSQQSQLQQLQKKLQQTQADYILVEGINKLLYLNEITYLRHVNMHPSGVVLTPESTKIIQNVHYLITHNLPVPRFKLYEILPDMFTKQIGELQQSTKKLIQEKNLNIFEQTTSSSIRRFKRKLRTNDPRFDQIIRLRRQRQNLYINICMQANQIMSKHLPFITQVLQNRTVFRDMRHCITVLISSRLRDRLNMTAQQRAFSNDVLQIIQTLQDWKSYAKDHNQRVIQLQYSYIQPPSFIKNHPVLISLYDQFMQDYTNPTNIKDMPNYLPDHEFNDDGRAWMEERLLKEVEKYDEEFIQLFNENKQLLMSKKKIYQLEFYKFSTRILEEYQALEDKSKPEEEFKKLPKKDKKKEEKYVRITLDELTKAIYLNNKDKDKYNLDFFAKYFGMEQNKKELFETFNSLSYLRVIAPGQEDQDKKQFSQQVLKFMV